MVVSGVPSCSGNCSSEMVVVAVRGGRAWAGRSGDGEEKGTRQGGAPGLKRARGAKGRGRGRRRAAGASHLPTAGGGAKRRPGGALSRVAVTALTWL